MLELNITVTGESQVSKTLLDVARRCENLGPAWELIHDDFLVMEEEQFGAQGKDEKWAPWSDDYAAWRKKHGATGNRILEWTGEFRRSLTEKGSPGHVFDYGPLWAKYGTDLKTESGYGLGLVHQQGFTAKYPYGNRGIDSKKVPARKSVVLDESHKQEWLRLIQGYIMQSKSIYPEHFG